jgi:hypothetical protein
MTLIMVVLHSFAGKNLHTNRFIQADKENTRKQRIDYMNSLKYCGKVTNCHAYYVELIVFIIRFYLIV